MNYWLFKTEPGAWSWQNQLDAPDQTTHWDGVRNYQAANNMKAMKIGDRGFFYHSIKEKQIVGIVEIVKLYHLDPTDEKGRFGMVDVKAVSGLPLRVTLAAIKAESKLEDISLVKQSRLSVMPIAPSHWRLICKMAGLKASK